MTTSGKPARRKIKMIDKLFTLLVKKMIDGFDIENWFNNHIDDLLDDLFKKISLNNLDDLLQKKFLDKLKYKLEDIFNINL